MTATRARRIERLTPEQEARLPLVRDAWLRRGLATGPCDRPAIERAIDDLYRARGYEPPKVKVWMDSPLGGTLAAATLARLGEAQPTGLRRDQLRDQLWDQLGDQLRDQLWDQLWDQLRDQLGDQLGDQLRDQLWGQLGGQLWDQLGDQLRDQLGDQLRDQLWDQLRDQLWDQLWGQLWDQLWDQLGDQLWDQLWDQLYRCGYGQHDGYWVAWCSFGHQIGVQLSPERAAGLDALDRLTDAGWWWPFTGAVVLTDRPAVLQRDEQGRLHAEDGPAIAYADGWALHAWHGVRVPPQVIEAPASLTVQQIGSEPNAEVRRVMIERFGMERYLRDAGATVLHTDADGLGNRRRLLSVPREDDTALVAVEVVNSTPEPDGSVKTYTLRVPPQMRTCQEAVAWTFGVEADEYHPAVET